MQQKVQTATTIKTAPQLSEGLWFNLNENSYHEDIALGSGDIRSLAKCAIFYWQTSWMNPLRKKRKEEPYLLFGRALHKLVLEGPDAFKSSYFCKPHEDDYPHALITADDIKRELKQLDIKTSGLKAELVLRLKQANPDAEIFDDILAEFDLELTRTGATALPRDMYADVVAAARFILSNQRVAPAFSKGRPEVSIFWIENGVPMKARLDYVKIGKDQGRPLGLVTDLKHFSNSLGQPPERAVIRSIAETRLDIQSAAYFKGIARIPEFIAAGKIFGAENINPEWLQLLGSIAPEDWSFNWAFYMRDAPIALLRSTTPTSPMIKAATMDVNRALASYSEHMQEYGTDWVFVDPIPDITISAEDLPRWMTAGA